MIIELFVDCWVKLLIQPSTGDEFVQDDRQARNHYVHFVENLGVAEHKIEEAVFLGEVVADEAVSNCVEYLDDLLSDFGEDVGLAVLDDELAKLLSTLCYRKRVLSGSRSLQSHCIWEDVGADIDTKFFPDGLPLAR